MQPAVKWLEDYLDNSTMLPEMQATMDEIQKWSTTNHGYESKNARLKEWDMNLSCFYKAAYYDIVCHIFINCLMYPQGMTYQAMIGSIAGDVACAHPLDRAKCAAEVIAIAYQCELIEITKVSDTTMMITTEFELDVDIPEFDKHLPEWAKPAPVTYNPILGNRYKQHEGDVCREHIDQMNAIPLALDWRVIQNVVEPAPASIDTPEQWGEWAKFLRASVETYKKVMAQNNRFYLKHSCDTRGRTYCEGYYINYQGSQYKKAIVQLADKEVVKL